MSRRKKRGRKRSAAVKSPESAALVSQEAGLPAEGGGPVSRPAWAPGDVDLFKVPEPVRRAVAEIVEPAYRKLVAEVEDPLERSIGLTLVHLMWLEVLDQHETKYEYLQTSILELPEDRSGMIDRHLRMLNTKVKVGSFLMRLREIRRQSEAAAPQKVSGVRDQVSVTPGAEVTQDAEHVCVTRLGGETEGECGKPESCHPKNEVSGVRDQVSEARSRGGESWISENGEEVSVTGAGATQDADHACATQAGDETKGECGKLESCHPKTEAGSWEMGVGGEKVSATRGRGGRPTAEEMKAATQETAAQLWQILARVENRRRNAENARTATQKTS